MVREQSVDLLDGVAVAYGLQLEHDPLERLQDPSMGQRNWRFNSHPSLGRIQVISSAFVPPGIDPATAAGA